MQRYNMFNLIHKALCQMMYSTALSIQQTSFEDIYEAEETLEKLETVLHVFEKHAHHEDESVLPAVEKFDAVIAAELKKEHVTDVSLGNKLKNLINIYRYCNFTEERINCGSAISKAFIDFMIFNLEHIGKEEILLNHILWKNYTDEELIDINRQIVVSLPSGESLFTSKWMIVSISNIEAIAWLSAIKTTTPEFVLHSILKEAESNLPAHRFETIREAVMQTAMVA